MYLLFVPHEAAPGQGPLGGADSGESLRLVADYAPSRSSWRGLVLILAAFVWARAEGRRGP